MVITIKVKNKREQKRTNKEWDNNFSIAQHLNRHERRMLGSINKIGMIPKAEKGNNFILIYKIIAHPFKWIWKKLITIFTS